MSRLDDLLGWLRLWLAEAADGWFALQAAARSPRRLRLSEGEPGRFRLERGNGAKGWREVEGDLRIADGQLASPLSPALANLLSGAEVELMLTTRHFVLRALDFPAQATPFLDGVVRSRINHVTPWETADAAFGFAPPRPLDRDRIEVQLVATARAHLAPYVGVFSALGAASLTISAALGEGEALTRATVLRESLGEAARRRRLSTTLAFGLAVVSAAFLVSLGASVIVGGPLEAERDALQSEIAARRAALRALRNPAESAGLAELAAKKRATLPVVLALEALSRALPDGAYLTAMTVEPSKLEIAGLSDDAPKLIRLIEQAGPFSHAAFSAPTVHLPNENGERFQIGASVETDWTRAP